MSFIYQQELKHSIRVGKELMNNNDSTGNPEETPKVTGRKLLRQIQEKKLTNYKQKALHGYFQKMIEREEGIDMQHSQQWLQDKCLTSNFPAYACAIQAGPSRASSGPRTINKTGPCAGVAAQGQEGASAPLKYYSAPPSESNFLRALLETRAPGIYPGYPPPSRRYWIQE